MKNFLSAAVLSLGFVPFSFAQNDPTIDAMYLSDTDPFCYNGAPKTLTIVVTDLDGDFVMVDPPMAVNNYLEVMNGSYNTVGNTTTFEFPIDINYGTPPPAGILSLEDLSASAYSSGGTDPTGLDFENLIGVEVNGEIAVDFTVPTLQICNTGNPVNLNDYVVTPGGTFNYLTSTWPDVYTDSPALNPVNAYGVYITNDYSLSISYEVTDVNGCSNYDFLSVDFYVAPEISTTITPSTCLGATGDATAEISGSAPFNVYWSNGFNEISSGISSISNLSSGVYYANVTDINGCKAVAKANVSDSDISVLPAVSASYCAGQNGNITLDITPSSGTVSSVYWSNGSTGSTISSGPGEYSVEIHTNTNCNYFGTYTIPDSALKIKLEGAYGNSNCISAPSGGIDIITQGGNMPYTWDWKKNGVSVYNTEDVWNIDGGVYTCTVTDNTGCSLTWDQTIENYNNVYLWTNEIQKPTCGNTNGSIDIFIDTFGDLPTVYSWSNGAVTEDLAGVPAGEYTLTYADQSGCTSFLTVKLENEKPYQPSICLLTVDTSLIYNQIVWEKDITQNVAGFNIYRETSVFGVFEKIAYRPYALESFYQDNDASPIDRGWRYRISTVNACGEESYESFVHKTIHVVANTSNGTDYTMTWDDYEGITYTSIDLHRYDATNGWITVGPNLPYGTNTFNDTPPVISGLDYLVTFNLADPCTSTKVQDHNSSRSNKSASVFSPGGSTAEIKDADLGYISIYPNPASELITLHVDNPELFQNYEVRDLNGRLVSSGSIFSNNTSIPLDELAPGLYVIQLYADTKIITEKFIKN